MLLRQNVSTNEKVITNTLSKLQYSTLTVLFDDPRHASHGSI